MYTYNLIVIGDLVSLKIMHNRFVYDVLYNIVMKYKRVVRDNYVQLEPSTEPRGSEVNTREI